MATATSKSFYYKEVLLKKDTNKRWIECYAVLYKNAMVFDGVEKHGNKRNTPIVEITNKTTCYYGESNCYRFPFVVQTGKNRAKFKCETKLQRFKWMFAIRLCTAGKPPEPIPNFITTQNTRTRTRSVSNKPSVKHAVQPITKPNVELLHSQLNGATHETKNTVLIQYDDTKSVVVGNEKTANRKRIQRSQSNVIEEELQKKDKKTVKWDMRNAFINYVNKGNTNRKQEKKNRTYKNENDGFQPEFKSSLKSIRHLKTMSLDECVERRFEGFEQEENLDKKPREDDELDSSYPTCLFTVEKDAWKRCGGTRRLTRSDETIIDTGVEALEHFKDCELYKNNTNEVKKPSLSRAKSWTSLNIKRLVSPVKRETSAPALRFSRYTNKVNPMKSNFKTKSSKKTF